MACIYSAAPIAKQTSRKTNTGRPSLWVLGNPRGDNYIGDSDDEVDDVDHADVGSVAAGEEGNDEDNTVSRCC